MHAFSNTGNSFQPHCCSLPGQLGRGAQLRKVQKVILENEPREDGPFLTVHGVLKPPMTWAGTAGAGHWPTGPTGLPNCVNVLFFLFKKYLQRYSQCRQCRS